MKMTPVQKAFFEYGKALGRLEEFKRDHQNHPCVQNLTMRHFWRTARVCCDQKTITNRHAELIRDAWQKRAVCRRMCGQCIHFSPNEWGVGKDGCLKRYWGVKTNRCAIDCQYWEPRKEGKQDV